MQSETYHMFAIYSDRREFDGDPKQTAIPIPVLCLQIIQECSFKPRETPQNSTFEEFGLSFGKCLYVK